MKLNYYTYTIKFKSSGVTSKICIKDAIDIYCTYQKKQAVLEKVHNITSKKLYFAKAADYSSIYYLMTPTQLHSYRKLDKASGTIEDLQSLIGSGSLEKVTYIHLDDQLPVIGIASSHGGAINDDVEFYLNQVLNGLSTTDDYWLELKPINSGVAKSNIKNINLVSEAKVLVRSDSKQWGKLGSFLSAKANYDNLEIEIKVKRVSSSRADIKSQIDPLLDIIQNDVGDKEFAKVYLKGKAYSDQETIKDILLDQTMVLFDVIYPKSGNTIESQIEDKRYANIQVERLAVKEFSKYSSKLQTVAPCQNWTKLIDSKSY